MRFGYPNPDRMLAEMESAHVVEWEAYAELLDWESKQKGKH